MNDQRIRCAIFVKKAWRLRLGCVIIRYPPITCKMHIHTTCIYCIWKIREKRERKRLQVFREKAPIEPVGDVSNLSSVVGSDGIYSEVKRRQYGHTENELVGEWGKGKEEGDVTESKFSLPSLDWLILRHSIVWGTSLGRHYQEITTSGVESKGATLVNNQPKY